MFSIIFRNFEKLSNIAEEFRGGSKDVDIFFFRVNVELISYDVIYF